MDESRRRADEWLDLVADLLAGPPAAWPHQAVLQLLVDTFDAAGGCHYVRYGHEPPVQRQFPGDMFAAHHDEHVALCQDEAANPHPVLRFYLITGYRQPCQVADVPDRIADRRTMDTWYGLHRSWDSVVPHQLAFPLRLDARANRSLLVGRENPSPHRTRRGPAGCSGCSSAWIATWPRWPAGRGGASRGPWTPPGRSA